MECPNGYEAYEMLREECIVCEFKSECKESRGSKKEVSEEKITQIKNEVRKNISIPESELHNYRGCTVVINKVMDEYKKAGLRKRKGYKNRRVEARIEIKSISKFPISDDKLNLLIDCAEYVFFGIK